MIPITPIVKLIAGAVLVVLVLFGASWCYERSRGVTGAQLDSARAKTALTEQKAAVAETILVERKADALGARVVYRTRRDSVLRFLTDTVLVKETIARADTLLVKDSLAQAAADSTIAAQKRVTASVRNELALALRPRYQPRLSTSASGLYDPIDASTEVSAQTSLRVVSRLALVVRVSQRISVGERPHLGVGVCVSF